MNACTVSRMPVLLPTLALALNAFFWGTSWWPFRVLQAEGLHPLWTTILVYALAVLAIGLLRPRALGQLLHTPALWLLMLGSGVASAAFNWGVVIGDVVRVVLLFYLMPLWSVLLARLLLHEPLTRPAGARVLMALCGAAIVLWPEGGDGLNALPWPRTLPDWLGLIGGFAFALNNVMLRREAQCSEEARALAVFLGGVLVAGTLAVTLAAHAQLEWPPAPAAPWLLMTGGLAVLVLVTNMALQFGAARLPANVTSLVLLSEVVWASGSAATWGDGRLSALLLIGGMLIVGAAVWAASEEAAPQRKGNLMNPKFT